MTMVERGDRMGVVRYGLPGVLTVFFLKLTFFFRMMTLSDFMVDSFLNINYNG